MAKTPKTPTRPIEIALLFFDNTWDTAIVNIPADTPDDEIEEACYRPALAHVPANQLLVQVAIYNKMEDES